MTALATWGGDWMPSGVTIEAPAESSYFLTERKARQLTDSIRADLAGAVIGMQLAREGHAHLALGYDSWHEYVIAEFGDIRELRLPTAERRALVASMCGAGLSVRDIRKAIGFSVGTIQADRVALGLSDAKPDVIDLDPPADPYAGMTRTAEALARTAAQADRGLTSIELDAETGWPTGTATGSLSRLERRGQVARTAMYRRNRAAYVVTDLGRDVLAAP